jgi:hypothetical protein
MLQDGIAQQRHATRRNCTNAMQCYKTSAVVALSLFLIFVPQLGNQYSAFVRAASIRKPLVWIADRNFRPTGMTTRYGMLDRDKETLLVVGIILGSVALVSGHANGC